MFLYQLLIANLRTSLCTLSSQVCVKNIHESVQLSEASEPEPAQAELDYIKISRCQVSSIIDSRKNKIYHFFTKYS